MNIIRAKDKEEVANYAAEAVFQVVLEKNNAVVGLATGSTPIAMYGELIKKTQDHELSWTNVITFNLDEYIGLDDLHPQSYRQYMEKNLFKYLDLKPENIHIPKGMAVDLKEECITYEKSLKAYGGTDIQVLGIGRNGHIGFNEPSDIFEPFTHVVDLDEKTIMDNSRFFDSIDEVPRQAISMGIQSIFSAKKIVLIATGEEKLDALEKMIYEPITPKLPASILQLHQNVVVISDQDIEPRK